MTIEIISIFSSVNQLMTKKDNTIDKWWCERSYIQLQIALFWLILKVMNILFTILCQKMLTGRACVNYMLYHHQITRNSSLSKVVVQLHLEQSTSVNSRVNFGTKFSWKVPAKNSFVQEERVVSTILLIEKVMMTLSNSYNLRSRVRGGWHFQNRKGCHHQKIIWLWIQYLLYNEGKRREFMIVNSTLG